MAEKYLIKQGYEIVDRRYKTKYGEIDLIAKHAEIICFVEVKYRKYMPEYALITKQVRRIVDAASVWVASNYTTDLPCMRFDMVCISNNGIKHFENAFSADVE